MLKAAGWRSPAMAGHWKPQARASRPAWTELTVPLVVAQVSRGRLLAVLQAPPQCLGEGCSEHAAAAPGRQRPEVRRRRASHRRWRGAGACSDSLATVPSIGRRRGEPCCPVSSPLPAPLPVHRFGRSQPSARTAGDAHLHEDYPRVEHERHRHHGTATWTKAAPGAQSHCQIAHRSL